MAIYEGVISLVGAGEWQTKKSGGGWTKLTAFDIGDHHIRNVKLPDYLSNYLDPGAHARVLVTNGLTGKLIEAVEVNGKKYKSGLALRSLVGKTLLVALLFGGIAALAKGLFSLTAVVVIVLFAGYQIKKYQAYLAF